ncbi:Oidioi.mRNA.OKI2018_I69.XSR.g15557.t1.cds [Oikopleura dioica]|uniref:Oidioi.mRNA.OKI2018_I69.XSR.g15557.t1.cds n=1 Tax=Oikopleura dioica TaxID=34765 RepID=A0ABN7SD85_OIKDI|nr:Oidioi.mRNA.OKI2018_I69.XSR.g15557.t1.cds [Oikopleura dioica]
MVFPWDGKERAVQAGQSFYEKSQCHIVTKKFVPTSIIKDKEGIFEINTEKRELHIKLPKKKDDSYEPIVFSGEFRQQEGKQCLIIVDKQTGQITLEKVTSKSLVGLTRETVIEKIHFKDKETPRVPTPDQASNRSEPKRLKLEEEAYSRDPTPKNVESPPDIIFPSNGKENMPISDMTTSGTSDESSDEENSDKRSSEDSDDSSDDSSDGTSNASDPLEDLIAAPNSTTFQPNQGDLQFGQIGLDLSENSESD